MSVHKCPNYKHVKDHYAGNALLKLNAKLVGVNHVPRPSESLLNDDKRDGLPWALHWPCMLLGVDLNHRDVKSKQVKDGQEAIVGAIVCSVDRTDGKFGAIDKQEGRKTQVSNTSMREGMHKLLLSLKRRHGQRELVLFRDGVSQDELPVAQREVQAMEEVYNDDNLQMTSSAEPKVTLLTTQKPYHTRLFFINDEKATSSPSAAVENISPGTVVDADIVRDQRWDFFLNSHKAVQDTTKCIHYCVLRDDSGFSQSGIELLSYTECYSYARANNEVSIPAPVYAHWASQRGAALLEHGCAGKGIEQASTDWLESDQTMWWL